MAQQMITLEEAAERLGISPEEMKKRLKTDSEFKKLSQIRDGSTVRFKVTAIDELGRQLGLASEDGLPMAEQELEPPGSDDFKVVEDKHKAPKKSASDEAPLDFGASDDEVFSLADDPKPAPPKSGKIAPKAPKSMSDSSHGSSDSDVRLDSGKLKKVKAPEPKSDEAAIPTEEIALDFGGPGSAIIKGGSSAKLSAPKSGNSSGKLDPSKGKGGKSGKPPVENDSSEFELSLDADSDDFDLQMNPDGDEVDLGALPKGKGGSDKRSSASGINLSDPADSGISLEKSKNKKKVEEDSDESDVDFELSLDSSAVSSSTKLGAPKSGKLVLDSDSDSEFELTLDDSGGSLEQAAMESEALAEEDKGDIFETDFEIPSMPDESGSEAVALESDTDLEKSDFELEMADGDDSGEESGSEVVLLEDEEAEKPARGKGKAKPQPLKGKKKPVVDDDGDVDLADDSVTDEDDASASKALRGAKAGRRGKADAEDEEVLASTKPWGIVPVLFLAPALLFTLVGALMGFELLQTMWGYQQPRKPAAPIVRGLATQLDMELRDQ
ncbi:hypothetical protein J8F10_00210 [Gemmata sp. G18]|uniref:DNA-binding protein n=1 Tax=Gemmata palustris TaxID=2822762 RepID=A0ABS5BJ46_9BACT|nr:hypothetical protein [Gemmata palustris]MBP3953723.1 hypothetical protein [Gemmata palustris]